MRTYLQEKYSKQPDIMLQQEEQIGAMITNMIQLIATGASIEQNGIAYADFFMFFSANPPADVTACISDWIVRA